MRLGGLISRRLSVGGLCCLLVVGGLPRSWCLCPDAACRAACDARSNLLAIPAASAKAEPCSCCENDSAASNEPRLALTQCPCETHVTQAVLLTASRDVQAEEPPPCVWPASFAPAPSLGPAELRLTVALFAALPPDDPVSRAQILRI